MKEIKKIIMKHKISNTKINIVIDIIMFIAMLIVAGIGFLINYVLVSGQQQNIIYGKRVDLSFAGLDRHDWGDIHLIVGFILIFLLLLHIVFHWKRIKSMFRYTFPLRSVRIAIVIILIFLTALLGVAPLFVKPIIESSSEHDNELHLRRENHLNQEDEIHLHQGERKHLHRGEGLHLKQNRRNHVNMEVGD